MTIILLTTNPKSSPTDQPRLTKTADIKAVQCLPGKKINYSLEQRALTLMQLLIQEGLSATMAAGFAGNASQESDIKPEIAGKSGVGICQWCGYRKKGLLKFASAQNKSWQSLEVQAKWIVHELMYGTEKEYLPKILSAKTPEEAAALISKYYERPKRSKANNKFRMAEAKRLYALISPNKDQ